MLAYVHKHIVYYILLYIFTLLYFIKPTKKFWPFQLQRVSTNMRIFIWRIFGLLFLSLNVCKYWRSKWTKTTHVGIKQNTFLYLWLLINTSIAFCTNSNKGGMLQKHVEIYWKCLVKVQFRIEKFQIDVTDLSDKPRSGRLSCWNWCYVKYLFPTLGVYPNNCEIKFVSLNCSTFLS